ncbi:TIGR01777 family oxidoreductase [Jatrophihabitans telluris]|uniref:TIGR01777 family oxidoreductase n=1 Tax=Jatrophihabitans telluris TaxID=2038343 RepID=A0ABY4QVV5_9ACTN|nr:TIGR01777 family oxidoreductase [Jatrophihabitans telluris]UQX87277.1 TIGR01777 family oxidoreductase [Jatrophihabitans telluris]
MKIVIAGASGFLGQALAQDLIGRGHRIVQLVRRPPKSPSEVEWHPERGELDPAVLSGADAVISLSGAGIEDKRWTPEYRRILLDSRVQPTTTIATTLAGVPEQRRPAVFLSASAIGFYGERGDQPLPEGATHGTGFLADLVVQWEAATAPAVEAGVRVCTLRTGLVLAASGGLLKRMIPLFKFGIGGKLGAGTQYQAWITLADEIGAIRHALETEAVSGPVNLVGPDPVRNEDFVRALGSVLHRPSIFPTPAFGLRLVLGQFADEGVLVSQRVIPQVLQDSGYAFEHDNLEAALRWAVAH